MLDLLLIPPALLVILALQAVRRGEHRLHGHLMAAAFTVVGLRVLLHSNGGNRMQLAPWLLTLSLSGITIFLGRRALAWREGRSQRAIFPRIHRVFGTLTLGALALSTLAWLLRPPV